MFGLFYVTLVGALMLVTNIGADDSFSNPSDWKREFVLPEDIHVYAKGNKHSWADNQTVRPQKRTTQTAIVDEKFTVQVIVRIDPVTGQGGLPQTINGEEFRRSTAAHQNRKHCEGGQCNYSFEFETATTPEFTDLHKLNKDQVKSTAEGIDQNNKRVMAVPRNSKPSVNPVRNSTSTSRTRIRYPFPVSSRNQLVNRTRTANGEWTRRTQARTSVRTTTARNPVLIDSNEEILLLEPRYSRATHKSRAEDHRRKTRTWTMSDTGILFQQKKNETNSDGSRKRQAAGNDSVPNFPGKGDDAVQSPEFDRPIFRDSVKLFAVLSGDSQSQTTVLTPIAGHSVGQRDVLNSKQNHSLTLVSRQMQANQTTDDWIISATPSPTPVLCEELNCLPWEHRDNFDVQINPKTKQVVNIRVHTVAATRKLVIEPSKEYDDSRSIKTPAPLQPSTASGKEQEFNWEQRDGYEVQINPETEQVVNIRVLTNTTNKPTVRLYEKHGHSTTEKSATQASEDFLGQTNPYDKHVDLPWIQIEDHEVQIDPKTGQAVNVRTQTKLFPSAGKSTNQASEAVLDQAIPYDQTEELSWLRKEDHAVQIDHKTGQAVNIRTQIKTISTAEKSTAQASKAVLEQPTLQDKHEELPWLQIENHEVQIDPKTSRTVNIRTQTKRLPNAGESTTQASEAVLEQSTLYSNHEELPWLPIEDYEVQIDRKTGQAVNIRTKTKSSPIDEKLLTQASEAILEQTIAYVKHEELPWIQIEDHEIQIDPKTGQTVNIRTQIKTMSTAEKSTTQASESVLEPSSLQVKHEELPWLQIENHEVQINPKTGQVVNIRTYSKALPGAGKSSLQTSEFVMGQTVPYANHKELPWLQNEDHEVQIDPKTGQAVNIRTQTKTFPIAGKSPTQASEAILEQPIPNAKHEELPWSQIEDHEVQIDPKTGQAVNFRTQFKALSSAEKSKTQASDAVLEQPTLQARHEEFPWLQIENHEAQINPKTGQVVNIRTHTKALSSAVKSSLQPSGAVMEHTIPNAKDKDIPWLQIEDHEVQIDPKTEQAVNVRTQIKTMSNADQKSKTQASAAVSEQTTPYAKHKELPWLQTDNYEVQIDHKTGQAVNIRTQSQAMSGAGKSTTQASEAVLEQTTPYFKHEELPWLPIEDHEVQIDNKTGQAVNFRTQSKALASAEKSMTQASDAVLEQSTLQARHEEFPWLQIENHEVQINPKTGQVVNIRTHTKALSGAVKSSLQPSDAVMEHTIPNVKDKDIPWLQIEDHEFQIDPKTEQAVNVRTQIKTMSNADQKSKTQASAAVSEQTTPYAKHKELPWLPIENYEVQIDHKTGQVVNIRRQSQAMSGAGKLTTQASDAVLEQTTAYFKHEELPWLPIEDHEVQINPKTGQAVNIRTPTKAMSSAGKSTTQASEVVLEQTTPYSNYEELPWLRIEDHEVQIDNKTGLAVNIRTQSKALPNAAKSSTQASETILGQTIPYVKHEELPWLLMEDHEVQLDPKAGQLVNVRTQTKTTPSPRPYNHHENPIAETEAIKGVSTQTATTKVPLPTPFYYRKQILSQYGDTDSISSTLTKEDVQAEIGTVMRGPSETAKNPHSISGLPEDPKELPWKQKEGFEVQIDPVTKEIVNIRTLMVENTSDIPVYIHTEKPMLSDSGLTTTTLIFKTSWDYRDSLRKLEDHHEVQTNAKTIATTTTPDPTAISSEQSTNFPWAQRDDYEIQTDPKTKQIVNIRLQTTTNRNPISKSMQLDNINDPVDGCVTAGDCVVRSQTNDPVRTVEISKIVQLDDVSRSTLDRNTNIQTQVVPRGKDVEEQLVKPTVRIDEDLLDEPRSRIAVLTTQNQKNAAIRTTVNGRGQTIRTRKPIFSHSDADGVLYFRYADDDHLLEQLEVEQFDRDTKFVLVDDNNRIPPRRDRGKHSPYFYFSQENSSSALINFSFYSVLLVACLVSFIHSF